MPEDPCSPVSTTSWHTQHWQPLCTYTFQALVLAGFQCTAWAGVLATVVVALAGVVVAG